MYEDIVEAAKRLDGVANKTPILTSRILNELLKCNVFLKCENFQRGGAFKFRGAYNAVSKLDPAIRKNGVITYSSGNHGMALALVGKLFNIPVTVIVPDNGLKVKLEGIKRYGANVIFYNRDRDDRDAIAKKFNDEHGSTLIPPFNSWDIINGQGTVGKEIFEAVEQLDYLVVQCSGGGLISGCSLAMEKLSPKCKIIGVEPEVSNDINMSYRSGERVTIAAPRSIADGLNCRQCGEITFPLIQKYVSDMVTVTEEEIVEATYFLWTRFKIVAEPSGAVSLAAILFNKVPVYKKNVAVIVSGGNVDICALSNEFMKNKM